jgi:hypothetical protein
MAGLFEGIAPPNVDTSRTTAQQAPGYLTDYLTKLAQAGTSALGTTTPAVKDAAGNITTPASFTPKTGEELIASRPDYYANLVGGIDPTTGKPYEAKEMPGLSDLGRYKTALDAATSAGKLAASPIGVSYDKDGKPVFSDTLQAFYDPFQKNVIDAMREASDVNLQRSVLPGLKAIGIGSGQFGSSRAGTLGGQALADYGAAANRQESELRSAGYKTALDAALRQQANLTGAASALGNIGGTEATASQNALKALAGFGEQDLAYDQSKIEAPLTRAANVAQILRGYNYPTTTTETYKGPASVYGPSVMSQIAGLGSLVGAMFPAGGGAGDRALNALKSVFGAQNLGGVGGSGLTQEQLDALTRQAGLDVVGMGDLPASFGGAGVAPYTQGDQGSDSGEGLFGPPGG